MTATDLIVSPQALMGKGKNVPIAPVTCSDG
jgi:hypothetical protein